MSKIKLNKCPLCKSKHTEIKHTFTTKNNKKTKKYFGVCTMCGTYTEALNTPSEAAENWNKNLTIGTNSSYIFNTSKTRRFKKKRR